MTKPPSHSSRRDLLVLSATTLATVVAAPASGIAGTVLLGGKQAPPSLATDARDARAQAWIDDIEGAGAILTMNPREPDTLWVGVPVEYGDCDDDRVEALKRGLHEQPPSLKRAVGEIIRRRYGLLDQREG